jgi:hypothetical protein
MPGHSRPSGGIPDWDTKLKVISHVLGAYTHAELVGKVYEEVEHQKDGVFAGQVLDNIRKWRKSRPRRQDGPKAFFNDLAVRLGCGPHVTGVMLVDADIERFIEYLPEAKRESARSVAMDTPAEVLLSPGPADSGLTIVQPIVKTTPALPSLQSLLLHFKGPVESIAKGIKAGRIDQRHYYLTPDAADGWNTLVRAEAYPTYDQCKAGLVALVGSAAWKEALEHSNPTTVVMLAGGGAPTKDMVFLRNLLDHSRPTGERISYFLVDVSCYMLMGSLRWLDEHLVTIPGHERVKLQLLYGDALNLQGCHSMFHPNGTSIFAITGGTIGNLSEEAFFRALEGVSDDGDLLVVSADTLDGLDLDDVERMLKKKYDHADVHSFIGPVVREVIGEFDLAEPVASILKRVKVSLRRGKTYRFSDVTGSWSVTLSLEVGGREITLISSTRYESSELVAYAAKFGWALLCKTPSPQNPQYLQFCFRRSKAE